MPSVGAHSDAVCGDLDRDGDLDVYGLRSDVDAGTNPRDFVYRNAGLRFTAMPGPVQRIELVFR